MRNTFKVMTALAGSMMLNSAAQADWFPGEDHKMHYPQLPDLTPTGMDVLATHRLGAQPPYKLLADDFRCAETGPISDIHIWGSWLDDRLPVDATGLPNPNAVAIKLSIHSDIPDPDGTGPAYSQPGTQLWSRVFTPGQFTVIPYSTLPDVPGVPGDGEWFYDPNTNQRIGEDHTVWQYNFDPIAQPFIQQLGTIYWLDVQAQPLGPTGSDALFGWKTTNPTVTPHFNDDAVFGDTAGFDTSLLVPPGWGELRYPSNHPYAGQSIDLAFVITPEPGSAMLGTAMLGVTMLSRRRRKQN